MSFNLSVPVLRVIFSLLILANGAKSHASINRSDFENKSDSGCDANFEQQNLSTFSARGGYASDYDLVKLFPHYHFAQKIHMGWIREIKAPQPLIIDAGGGTGNMVLAAQKARPDARVVLMDLNQNMLTQAEMKGVPRENISHTDIRNMQVDGLQVANQSVDHILSHSVLWLLDNPGDFFREANRVLKINSTLAVSTAAHPTEELVNAFLECIDQKLCQAEQLQLIDSTQHANFLNANRSLILALNSPLSKAELISLARKHGFEFIENFKTYVVETSRGPEGLFNQALFYKKQNRD